MSARRAHGNTLAIVPLGSDAPELDRDNLAAPPSAQALRHDAAIPGDEVLTVEEGAKLLRVGCNQLHEAISRGHVPHMRIERSIRLLRSALVRSLSRSW